MTNDTPVSSFPLVQGVFQALFSLNAALLSVSIAFLAWPRTSVLFVYMEVQLNTLLRIQQTDMIRGYFAFSIAAAALTVVVWIALYGRYRTKRNRFQDVCAGILILLTPPLFWVYCYGRFGWPFGWPFRGIPFELAVVLVWAVFFVLRRCPQWVAVPLLAAHYAYWFLVPRRGFYPVSNSGGLVPPILGYLTALIWVFYFHVTPTNPQRT
jgi:hypothetical protein